MDHLIFQFEEYITAALSAVRYRDFMAKGDRSGVVITGGSRQFFLPCIT